MRPVVAGPVLDTDQRRLGPRVPEAPPLLLAAQDRPVAHDAPVKVVRAEEGEVPAAVWNPSISSSSCRVTYSVVPGEHDQVVATEKRRGVRDALEIDVGEEVRVGASARASGETEGRSDGRRAAGRSP